MKFKLRISFDNHKWNYYLAYQSNTNDYCNLLLTISNEK